MYLIGCGSRPTTDLPRFAGQLRSAGWDPFIVPTPVGRRFLNASQAEEKSGNTVYWDFDPDAPNELTQCKARAAVIAPATFNTINKLAAGIADTLALALVHDVLGDGLPVIAVPWTQASLARHPAYKNATARLRGWGVRLLPADQSELFPWAAVGTQLEQVRGAA
ncbi:flavoprotein [Kitasatospora acidiphila]|uniref:flavoprotein n=1 Tax=Kitasatospora acidiphila TaxID=2567942 RepID=UPI001E5B9C96|nr:flavoprotein [Kitasatospora acidiphila]